MSKRDEKQNLEGSDEVKRRRKYSFDTDQFQTDLFLTNNKIIGVLAKIPQGTKFALCFTSSIVIRAMNPNEPLKQEFLDYLRWRYDKRRKITDDCDVIFEQDPPEWVQRQIRHHNEQAGTLRIDWWSSTDYTGDWAKVKRRSLKTENVLNIPCQPYKVLYKAKRDLLSCDIKHKKDVEILPDYK